MSQQSKLAANERTEDGSSKDGETAISTGHRSGGEIDFRSRRQRINDFDLRIAISERRSKGHDLNDACPPPLLTFPLLPNHPLVRDWPDWAHEVSEALATCGTEWLRIGVFNLRRSKVNTGRHPTVKIVVCDWAENLERAKKTVEAVCERNGYPLLNVDVVHRESWGRWG
ncbi:MAG: hypothetical protein M1813_003467 [Trichoglossum hirsutum]|nr:MAG: hypothetical protein M1813_003467 [Trichoglossum hirsutum]